MNLNKEAAVIVTTVTTLLGTVLTTLVVFGVDLSDDQRNAVTGTATAFLTTIFVIGPFIRQFVFSKNTAKAVAEEAAATGEVPAIVK